MEKKITKVETLSDIIAILKEEPTQFGITLDTAIEFLTVEMERLVNRKNSSKEKSDEELQAIDIENTNVLNFLGTVAGANATEIANACNLPNNQKATSICKRLIASGQITSGKVKNRNIYRLA